MDISLHLDQEPLTYKKNIFGKQIIISQFTYSSLNSDFVTKMPAPSTVAEFNGVVFDVREMNCRFFLFCIPFIMLYSCHVLL
jgi:hypothetical protein